MRGAGLASWWLSVAGASIVLVSCAPVAPKPTSPAVPPAAPGGAVTPLRLDHEPMIEVGIRWDIDSVTVVPRQASPLDRLTNGTPQRVGETDGPIQVRRTSGGWELAWQTGGQSRTTPFGPRDTLWVGTEEKAGARLEEGNRFRMIGQTWRGRFKVFLNPRSKLTVVSRLPLETYLLGVIPGEIGGLTNETLEAGRAQTIAARSYTLFYMGRRAAEGFDLYGNVLDQVYGAIETEREMPTACVQFTRGYIALSAGQPIRANYSSTCGGITADVWEAWAADPLPYLVSHRDLGVGQDYCSGSVHHRWREEWSAQEFMGNVTRFSPLQGVKLPPEGLGELVDVRALSRSRSGRVWKLRVETTLGDVTIPAEQIRPVLRRAGDPLAILRSNLFKIAVKRDRATRKAISVVATGGGSGHGVGLCQTGALAMSRSRKTAAQILEHYYPGIQVRRLY
jgi:stage II sporulation protein D